MSTMSIVARPSASAISATIPGPVRDEHAQLVHLAARQIGLQQPPAIVARGVVPGRDRVPVTGRERSRTAPNRATRSSIAATNASALAA